MLFVIGPAFLVGLFPIIAIESAWLCWKLKLPFARTSGAVSLANFASTIVGIPATWFVLVLLQLMTGGGSADGVGVLAVTWQAAWLIPYEGSLHWMIPAAAIFLNIPFFLVSAFVEQKIVVRTLADVDPQQVRRRVIQANAATYALMSLFWLGILGRALLYGRL
jgi:hypothetical protein